MENVKVKDKIKIMARVKYNVWGSVGVNEWNNIRNNVWNEVNVKFAEEIASIKADLAKIDF